MNARKLIVMDLDGTLLNEEGIVTQKTKEYLGKLKKEGYVIALATALLRTGRQRQGSLQQAGCRKQTAAPEHFLSEFPHRYYF